MTSQAMWTLRESIPEALLRDGYAWLYDVSLPHHKFYESVVDMRQHLSRFGSGRISRICGFGHLGKYANHSIFAGIF
ncbi:D-2-hydroxyglutarate dehydrogenase, mitochondrial [Amphibalanus amphitrite]|uniref:D-2-hydroxyglutarate dehydrogenase, mitochondrial n=1 Tax=Amphibalanus amphitrite TaxID=1232801 RepID=A0A6A4VNU3_AMPAM|nr:D-2-hydroxyglutarate dehydrogenase, mitochondrial [Amphibalanus amphitrite]